MFTTYAKKYNAPLCSRSPGTPWTPPLVTCPSMLQVKKPVKVVDLYHRMSIYLPSPSQPQLVFIYRPRRDGRLSRPWCEVAQAEIRTCNLTIANPALYHTAASAGARESFSELAAAEPRAVLHTSTDYTASSSVACVRVRELAQQKLA